jgi:hypothetical protein
MGVTLVGDHYTVLTVDLVNSWKNYYKLYVMARQLENIE